MTINLELDDDLIRQARRLGHHKTKKEAVNAALNEYVKLQKRLGLLALAGKIDYDPTYNYKDGRSRKKSLRK